MIPVSGYANLWPIKTPGQVRMRSESPVKTPMTLSSVHASDKAEALKRIEALIKPLVYGVDLDALLAPEQAFKVHPQGGRLWFENLITAKPTGTRGLCDDLVASTLMRLQHDPAIQKHFEFRVARGSTPSFFPYTLRHAAHTYLVGIPKTPGEQTRILQELERCPRKIPTGCLILDPSLKQLHWVTPNYYPDSQTPNYFICGALLSPERFLTEHNTPGHQFAFYQKTWETHPILLGDLTSFVPSKASGLAPEKRRLLYFTLKHLPTQAPEFSLWLQEPSGQLKRSPALKQLLAQPKLPVETQKLSQFLNRLIGDLTPRASSISA